MFSVHEANHVTLLSCCTLPHLCPGGGSGATASLCKGRGEWYMLIRRGEIMMCTTEVGT